MEFRQNQCPFCYCFTASSFKGTFGKNPSSCYQLNMPELRYLLNGLPPPAMAYCSSSSAVFNWMMDSLTDCWEDSGVGSHTKWTSSTCGIASGLVCGGGTSKDMEIQKGRQNMPTRNGAGPAGKYGQIGKSKYVDMAPILSHLIDHNRV